MQKAHETRAVTAFGEILGDQTVELGSINLLETRMNNGFTALFSVDRLVTGR